MNNQRFCPKCGTALEAPASFCPKCGERIAPQPVAAEPTPIEQYNMNVQAKKESKIDIKKTLLGNIIPAACFTIGIILLIVGLSTYIPSSYLSSYGVTEYVGGDAYNYIIAAAIRGGYISGAETAKAIYIAAGLVIACVSALKIKIVKPEKNDD